MAASECVMRTTSRFKSWILGSQSGNFVKQHHYDKDHCGLIIGESLPG